MSVIENIIVNCENDQFTITTQKLKDNDTKKINKTIKESKDNDIKEKTKKKIDKNIEESKNNDIKEKTKKKIDKNIEELKDENDINDIKEKTKKKPIHKSLKIAVWNKYIGEDIGKTKCLCCEITEITQLKFHCGHIIAECEGGETNITNLIPICESCNKSMNKMNLYEFKKLITENKETNKTEIKNENMEIKIKLDELINKLKKYGNTYCSYYHQRQYIRTIEYAIISETFKKFLIGKIECNSNGFLSKFYTHKKCNYKIDTGFNNESFSNSNSYFIQTQFFIKHIECLKNDNEYINFLISNDLFNKTIAETYYYK